MDERREGRAAAELAELQLLVGLAVVKLEQDPAGLAWAVRWGRRGLRLALALVGLGRRLQLLRRLRRRRRRGEGIQAS